MAGWQKAGRLAKRQVQHGRGRSASARGGRRAWGAAGGRQAQARRLEIASDRVVCGCLERCMSGRSARAGGAIRDGGAKTDMLLW